MDDSTATFVVLVLAAAEELNPSLEEPVDVARGAEAPLYGDDGPLDSLALVTLTSTVEQRLEDELGIVVTLTDERAFSQARSPFRTVGALAEFAANLLEPASGRVEVAPADQTGRPVALVTGSRSGIGRSVAEHLVATGSLVVGCSRNEADWSLDGYTHVVADVGDERQVRSLFSAVRKEHGRLDHVVSCAGAASMNHALLTPASTFERLLSVNTMGTFLVAREAAKVMQPRKAGRIVNVTTVAVALALAGEAAYVAAKAAVEALTRVLARELGPLGVTVNAVGPGPIPTALIKGVPDKAIDELLARLAIPRMATFADVANVVDFFLADASAMVTGQIVYLGGAW